MRNVIPLLRDLISTIADTEQVVVAPVGPELKCNVVAEIAEVLDRA